MSKSDEFYQSLTNRLIDQLEEGVAPWQRTWDIGEYQAPFNPSSGTIYRGVNLLNLSMSKYTNPQWLTFNQISEAGGKVNRGEKGSKIIFYRYTDERVVRDANGNILRDDDGTAKKENYQRNKPVVQLFTVFNVEQCSGLENLQVRAPEPTFTPEGQTLLERVSLLAKNAGAVLHEIEGKRAYYSPLNDHIVIPAKSQFMDAEDGQRYAAALLHELGHWTGHESRLNRPAAMEARFGTEEYAKEELRAELTSLFLSAHFDFGHDGSTHAAYVDSWIKALKDDYKEIHRASRDARAIAEYLIGFDQQQNVHNDQESQKDNQVPVDAFAEKTYLKLPYSARELAKEAGAKWDAAAKQWYAPEGTPCAALLPYLATSDEVAKDITQSVKQASGSASKVYLDVPYSERVDAKTTGARWDGTAKQWYVPEGVPIDAFARWQGGQAVKDNAPPSDVQKENAPLHNEQPKPAARLFLHVPYAERQAAKEAGAKWDNAAKSWYAPTQELAEKLQRWKDAPAQPDPKEEFAHRLQDIGFDIDASQLIDDGNKHRHKVDGDKGANNSGAGMYVFNGADKEPWGYAKNNKTGEEVKYRSTQKGVQLSAAERAQNAENLAEARRNLAAATAARQEKVATTLRDFIETCEPAHNHEYLIRKNVPALGKDLFQVPIPNQQNADPRWQIAATQKEAFALLKENQAKPDAERILIFTAGDLVVPASGIDGQLQTVQTISSQKYFPSGGKKTGAFCVVGGELNPKEIIIAEGIATAGTIAAATGKAVVSAFDSGNLAHVGQAMRAQFGADAKLVFCADDDWANELEGKPNAGLEKAKQAAKECNGMVIVPEVRNWDTTVPYPTASQFANNELSEQQQAQLVQAKSRSDFNDLVGADVKAAQASINAQITAELENYRDFPQVTCPKEKAPEIEPARALEHTQGMNR
ncbi:MAG: DUF5710 domain-containing protein [Ferrimonas sp.]